MIGPRESQEEFVTDSVVDERAVLESCERGLWDKLRELLAFEATVEVRTDLEPRHRRALRSLVRAHIHLVEEMLELTMLQRHFQISED
jgi:hypothetical protein